MGPPLRRPRRPAPKQERQRGHRACGGGAAAERSPPVASRAPEPPPVSSERNMAAAHREGVGCQRASRTAGHAETRPGGQWEAQRRRWRDREDPGGAATARRQGLENASGSEADRSEGEMDRRASESPRIRARQWRQDCIACPQRAHGRRQDARMHDPRAAPAGDEPGREAPSRERESPTAAAAGDKEAPSQ